MSNYEQSHEASHNLIKALSDEITEIKKSNDKSNRNIETIIAIALKLESFSRAFNDKLDRSIAQMKSRSRTFEVTPELVDLVKWPVILIIAILFITKTYTFFKGDAPRYKAAWRELYNASDNQSQYYMDSILFYGHGVRLDSIKSCK